jgi:endonuclease YncB( thermonuclease family)
MRMPITSPIRRKHRIFGACGLFYVIFAGIAITALHTSFRDQYGELIAPFTSEPALRKPAEVVATRLPTVVKLESGASPSGGPRVINLGSGALGAVSPDTVRVVDANTVFYDGKTYQLVGYSPPDAGPRARCAAERELAARAVRRLRQIVASGNLRLQRVPCGCLPGIEGTDRCNHGRLCAVLTVADRDVAQILIGEGFARRYTCLGDNCPPKQPWC